MSNCIFCKIVQGEIPCAKVYEDEHVLAFLDISQVTKGHTLVIPKVHQENVFALTDETAAALFQAVPKIAQAIQNAYAPAGINILNNNGEFAGQTVFHYHLHLIPRYDHSDGFSIGWETNEGVHDLGAVAGEIKNNLLQT